MGPYNGDQTGTGTKQEWGPNRNGDPTEMEVLRKGDPIGMVALQE